MNNEIKLKGGKYFYMVDQNRIINSEIKEIFLANKTDQTIRIEDQGFNEELIKNKVKNLSMVTLEVTQECNLRCKYCVFNENYENYRPFTSNKMTWEMAKNGIDYIYALVREKENKKFDVGFYGGEPLLNTRLIKKVVEYSKKIFKGWALSFSMTTNLTAADLDTLKLLIENKFNLTISLDGDKHNHDAKRVFVNGKGTHDTVLKNLQIIKNISEDFYKKNISFTVSHSFDLPFTNIRDFFEKENLVNENSVRLSNVNPFNTDYYKKFPWDRKKIKQELHQLDKDILEKHRNQKKLTKLEEFLDNSSFFEVESHKYRIFKTTARTCLFDSRLFIDATGNFHICEKMNNAFTIGNVESGLDFSRMTSMLQSFTELIKKKCSSCEVRFLCSRCFANFASDGIFEIPEGFCEGQKKNILKNLEKYIQHKEEGLR